MQLLSPSIVLVSVAVRPDNQEQSRIKRANAGLGAPRAVLESGEDYTLEQNTCQA